MKNVTQQIQWMLNIILSKQMSIQNKAEQSYRWMNKTIINQKHQIIISELN